jgi:hypothetical protein
LEDIRICRINYYFHYGGSARRHSIQQTIIFINTEQRKHNKAVVPLYLHDIGKIFSNHPFYAQTEDNRIWAKMEIGWRLDLWRP